MGFILFEPRGRTLQEVAGNGPLPWHRQDTSAEVPRIRSTWADKPQADCERPVYWAGTIGDSGPDTQLFLCLATMATVF